MPIARRKRSPLRENRFATDQRCDASKVAAVDEACLPPDNKTDARRPAPAALISLSRFLARAAAADLIASVTCEDGDHQEKKP
jgi:hypothetical protein